MTSFRLGSGAADFAITLEALGLLGGAIVIKQQCSNQ
jgi:hypothetical protein